MLGTNHLVSPVASQIYPFRQACAEIPMASVFNNAPYPYQMPQSPVHQVPPPYTYSYENHLPPGPVHWVAVCSECNMTDHDLNSTCPYNPHNVQSSISYGQLQTLPAYSPISMSTLESEFNALSTSPRPTQSIQGPKNKHLPELNRVPGGSLFIFHLPPSATKENLFNLFSPFGRVVNVHIAVQKKSKVPKGFGFVDFASASEADAAIVGRNGYKLGSKYLSVTKAR